MQCPRCLNTNPEFFYHGHRGWYCRKCISFGRAILEEAQTPISLTPIQEGSEEYTFTYPLTKAQARISHDCCQAIQTSDVLLYCVCGAGKTELVVESIAYMLKERKKICFAIPRRQVVLELRQRLANYFPRAHVVAVCGGFTEELDGDIIVCTTHQLYRYYQAFDLLILDEPDAYPFRGNEVLHGIAQTACKGHRIYLTATPDAYLKKQVKKKEIISFTLNERPHGYPLPAPKIKIQTKFGMYLSLLRFLYRHQDGKCIVFVPTIAMANLLGFFLHYFFMIQVCTSQTEGRDEVILNYRKQKKGAMLATTILERGITIPNVAICVFYAEHPVFDLAAQIQMAGRAGRSFQYPTGEVLFLQNERCETSEECLSMIRKANLSCVA